MKIVRCSKCGKYIHEADKCFHCGNMSDFEEMNEITIHDNVAQDYFRMGVLVEEKKFDEAISISYDILEWMPLLASVYWLRLLAKNRCTKATELIIKGFPCIDDADFFNALRFSSGEEHSAYEDIQKAVCKIRQSLLNEITAHEYKCKVDTKFMDIKKEIPDEIEKRKKKLFSLWIDLERIEQSLFELEMDCRLLAKEYQTGLEQAALTAASIKAETDSTKVCTSEKIHKFQVRVGNALQLSESSKASLNSMKNQHPWVKRFSEIVTNRDQQVELINSELSSLKSYEKMMEQIVTEIECIEKRHKTVRISVDKYNFREAASLLGVSGFEQVIRSSGIICDSIIELTFDKKDTSDRSDNYHEVDFGKEDKWGNEDYYSLWRMNELGIE